jgi:predicted kinase
MSCVLSIAGKKLDIDAFILKSGLRGFVKKYKEENITSKSNQGKQYSFVSATISDADLNNFEKQVFDAIVYLKKNRKKLILIGKTKEIEYATINFLVSLKSVSDKYFAQYIYLPKELTILCGSLNIGIEVAIV